MQLIRRAEITGGMMTSNVPEDDAPLYDAANAPFAEGDKVVLNHVVYESQVGENMDDPKEGASSTPNTWVNLGPSRPWKVFDGKVRDVTTALEFMDPVKYTAQDDRPTMSFDFAAQNFLIAEMQGIAYTLEPDGLVDSVALLNIEAVSVHVKVENASGVIVYEKRVSVSGELSESSFYAYFFSPIERKTQVLLTDLPASRGVRIHIALESYSYPAQLGELIIGRSLDIGRAQYGTGLNPLDLSKYQRDEFGNLEVVERRYINVADYKISIDRKRFDATYRIVLGLRFTPTLYIGSSTDEALTVFGTQRRIYATYENFSVCEYKLEVQEV